MTRAGREIYIVAIVAIVAAALALSFAACGGEGPSAGEGNGGPLARQPTTRTTTSNEAPPQPPDPRRAAVTRAARAYLIAFARGRNAEACDLVTQQGQAILASIGTAGDCPSGIETLRQSLTPGTKRLLLAPFFTQVKIDDDKARVRLSGSRRSFVLSNASGQWLISSVVVPGQGPG